MHPVALYGVVPSVALIRAVGCVGSIAGWAAAGVPFGALFERGNPCFPGSSVYKALLLGCLLSRGGTCRQGG